MAALGLCCSTRALSGCEAGLLITAAVLGLLLLTVVPSLAAEHGLWGAQASAIVVCGLVAVLHRLSCPEAQEIFPEQGWNLCPLHWHVDS